MKFVRRFFRKLLFKAQPDPLLLAKQLLAACKGLPIARGHVKEAMRAILDYQMEYDDEPAT